VADIIKAGEPIHPEIHTCETPAGRRIPLAKTPCAPMASVLAGVCGITLLGGAVQQALRRLVVSAVLQPIIGPHARDHAGDTIALTSAILCGKRFRGFLYDSKRDNSKCIKDFAKNARDLAG
jgi:hypothetical protein